MRNYEIMIVVHPDLDDVALSNLIDKVKTWITDAGGDFSKLELWGKRKMAYPIRKQREGQYALIKAQFPPAFSAQLEQNLRLSEPVLRFLVIGKE